MNDPLEGDIESIEAYLDGTLPIPERNAFEERLKADKDFRAEFESFRVSYQAIMLQSRKELKDRLKSLDKNKLSETKTINWQYISLAVAASLSLAILVINLLSSPSTEDLYNKYYSTYPNVVAPIERSEPINDPYKKAFQLYEDARYNEALPEFQKLLSQNPQLPDVNLYAGLSALALKDSKKATIYFDAVIKNSPNDFLETAKWYSALAYLQQENKAQAKAMLVQLQQNDFYGKHAEQLLRELE